jgi:hypothetical protein
MNNHNVMRAMKNRIGERMGIRGFLRVVWELLFKSED